MRPSAFIIALVSSLSSLSHVLGTSTEQTKQTATHCGSHIARWRRERWRRVILDTITTLTQSSVPVRNLSGSGVPAPGSVPAGPAVRETGLCQPGPCARAAPVAGREAPGGVGVAWSPGQTGVRSPGPAQAPALGQGLQVIPQRVLSEPRPVCACPCVRGEPGHRDTAHGGGRVKRRYRLG